jgi:hypothetical protein
MFHSREMMLWLMFGVVHIGSEKLMCHVSPQKINNIFHGNFEINSTVKLKRIEKPSLKLGFYH